MLKFLIFACLHLLVSSSQCDVNCIKCSGHECLECTQNFILSNSKCFDCASCGSNQICSQCPQKTVSNIVIVGEVLGAVAGVVSITLIACFIYRRRNRWGLRHRNYKNKVNLNIQLMKIDKYLAKKWISGQPIKTAENCAICLDNQVNMMTQCGHLYHAKCIKEWCIKKEVSCPLCKSQQLQPIHMYCPKCLHSYIQIWLDSIVEFQICKECAQSNVDQIYTR